jgi:hypothetical protein
MEVICVTLRWYLLYCGASKCLMRHFQHRNDQDIYDGILQIHIFIHSIFCLTTGSTPLPKRFLHVVRSRASSFKWEYPLLPLRSSNSFLRLLSRLLVTSISPFIFPSITCFRRQFRRKMWPISKHYLVQLSVISNSFAITLLQTLYGKCLKFNFPILYKS